LIEITGLFLCLFKLSSRFQPRASLVNFTDLRDTFAFSAHVVAMNFGWVLMYQSAAPLIGYWKGTAAVVYFTLPTSLASNIMQFVTGIATIVMPVTIRLRALKRESELTSIFMTWSKLAFAATCSAGAYIFVFGEDFLTVWVGQQTASQSILTLKITMLAFLVFIPLRGIALPILMGGDAAASCTLSIMGAGGLNVLLCVALVPALGIMGASWAWALSLLALSVALLLLIARDMRMAVQQIAHIYQRGVVGLVLVVLLLSMIRHYWVPNGLFAVALSALLSFILFVCVWISYVFRNDPDVPWRKWLRGTVSLW
jgi:O-antigen/teichoic acid export membrane protein